METIYECAIIYCIKHTFHFMLWIFKEDYCLPVGLHRWFISSGTHGLELKCTQSTNSAAQQIKITITNTHSFNHTRTLVLYCTLLLWPKGVWLLIICRGDCRRTEYINERKREKREQSLIFITKWTKQTNERCIKRDLRFWGKHTRLPSAQEQTQLTTHLLPN